jgi:hypothetical protein
VLKDAAGVELPPPARKTIDFEGRIVKDGVRKALQETQIVLLKRLRQSTRRVRWPKDVKSAAGVPNCTGSKVCS